jgi:hypothetical protein
MRNCPARRLFLASFLTWIIGTIAFDIFMPSPSFLRSYRESTGRLTPGKSMPYCSMPYCSTVTERPVAPVAGARSGKQGVDGNRAAG